MQFIENYEKLAEVMEQFSKEQMQKLAKYETYFITATRSGYIRGLSRQQSEEIAEIFREAGGKAQVVHGCPVCLFDFIKTVAMPYFAAQAKFESEDNKVIGAEAKVAKTGKKAAKKR